MRVPTSSGHPATASGKVPVSIVAAQVAPGSLNEYIPVAPGQTRLWNRPDAPEVAGYFDRAARGGELLETAADALVNEIVTGRHGGLAAVDVGALHAVEQVAAKGVRELCAAEDMRTTGGAPVWAHAALDVAQAIENVRLGAPELALGIELVDAQRRSGDPGTESLPERNQALGRLGLAESQLRGAVYLLGEAPRTHDDWVGDHYTKMATTPTMATLWPERRRD